VFRLAPKVIVAVTTVIASTAPNITERTGTVLRPRPPSRANRRPAIPATGIPVARPTCTMLDPCSLACPREVT
jgi:hypothetical protein